MFAFENSRSVILDSLADHHFSANLHQIEHATNCITGSSIRLFFFSSANPGQRVEGRRLGRTEKVKLDYAFHIFISRSVSAHDSEKNVKSTKKQSSGVNCGLRGCVRTRRQRPG